MLNLVLFNMNLLYLEVLKNVYCDVNFKIYIVIGWVMIIDFEILVIKVIWCIIL